MSERPIDALRAEDTISPETEYPCLLLHKDRLSPSLAKACVDPFDYAIKLRTGETFRFTQAHYSGGDFVTLDAGSHWVYDRTIKSATGYPAPRGIDVRISDIVWCMDAPEGS